MNKILFLVIGGILGGLAWMYATNPQTFKADAYCLLHGYGVSSQVSPGGWFCVQDGLITHHYVDEEFVNKQIQAAKDDQARTEERRRIFLEDRARVEQQRQLNRGGK